MENIIYPAVFSKAEEGGYNVFFPDVDGCYTQGDTLEEAFLMASDALFAFFDAFGIDKSPTPLEKVASEESDLVMLVKAEPYDNADELAKERARKELSKAIETGLKDKGYTKTQAAQILGVDRSYMSHIINGNKTPSQEFALRLGLLIGMDLRPFVKAQ